MSEFAKIAADMTPNIYQRLKSAVELGKWPDGRLLSDEQKQISLQAVIAYEIAQNLPEDQRIGYIEGGTSCGGPAGKEKEVKLADNLSYRVGQ